MILVTGATGTIGRELVQQLSSHGQRVRAFVHDPEKALALRNPNVEIALGDAADPATIARAMPGVERMFLLTSADSHQVQHQGRLVEAAKHAGIRHVVKLSARGAATNAPTALGRWHAETEQEIEASGMAWTHLRPSWFVQNLRGLAARVAEERVLAVPAGAGRVAMVDTRDIAAVAARILENPDAHAGRVYELTGPEAVSFEEIAAKITRVVDRLVHFEDEPPEATGRRLREAGLPDWLVADRLVVYAGFRDGQGAGVTDAVPRLTGYEARPVDSFIREHAFTFGA